jgi:hypothetical protein
MRTHATGGLPNSQYTRSSPLGKDAQGKGDEDGPAIGLEKSAGEPYHHFGKNGKNHFLSLSAISPVPQSAQIL